MKRVVYGGASWLALACALVTSPALAQYIGACSDNGVCSEKYEIDCIRNNATAKLAGRQPAVFLGNYTTCNVSCSLKAYGANQAVAVQFFTSVTDKMTGQTTVTPLSPSSITWSLKNSAGAVAASGTTSTPLTYPIVDATDIRQAPRVAMPPGALVAPAAVPVGFYALTATGKDTYGRTYTPTTLGGTSVRIPGLSPPPSNLAATVGTAVNVSWAGVDPKLYAATGTSLKAGTASAGPFSTVLATNVAGTSYSVPLSALAGASTWYVVASTVNATGEGPASAPAQVSLPLPTATPVPPPPAAPTNLVATNPRITGAVQLTWTASANAKSYTVFKSTTSGGGWSAAGTVAAPATTLTVSGLTLGVPYYFVVNASAGGPSSGMSNQVSFTPPKIMY